MTEKPVRRRPGGRTAKNRERVIGATIEVLLSSGYEGLTVARIAEMAGLAESTIYRRWPTKAQLAAAAIAELAELENPIPDTGSLKGDLQKLLDQINVLLNRSEVQRVLRTAMALDTSDPEVSELTQGFWAARFAGSADIVARAAQRGELPDSVDAYELIEHLVGATYFRVLVTRRPLDRQLIKRSVDAVLRTWAIGP